MSGTRGGTTRDVASEENCSSRFAATATATDDDDGDGDDDGEGRATSRSSSRERDVATASWRVAGTSKQTTGVRARGDDDSRGRSVGRDERANIIGDGARGWSVVRDNAGDDDEGEDDSAPATATAVLVNALSSIVDQDDVARMRETQLRTLSNLQDSNAVLGSFNDFCDSHLPNVAHDLGRSARIVRAIKADLTYIHKHSRALRARMKALYPEAFEGVPEYQVPDE